MTQPVLGRTNAVFPPIWLSLSVPNGGFAESAKQLVDHAVAQNVPLDITSQPALWGGCMRGTEATLLTVGGPRIENATEEDHAMDLVQAHLIETLSSIGREYIDFYFLKIRRGLEEYQINGALAALESAKQEGNVRFIGLYPEGPPMAILGVWQFHDAFETVLLPKNPLENRAYDNLAPLAKERRAGVVTTRPLRWDKKNVFTEIGPYAAQPLPGTLEGLPLEQLALAKAAQSHPTLVGVTSIAEIDLAIAASGIALPDGYDEIEAAYVEALRDPAAAARHAEVALASAPSVRQSFLSV